MVAWSRARRKKERKGNIGVGQILYHGGLELGLGQPHFSASFSTRKRKARTTSGDLPGGIAGGGEGNKAECVEKSLFLYMIP